MTENTIDTHCSSPTVSTTRPPLIGLAVLARMAFAGADFRELSAQLLARAEADSGDANALMDFSTILQLTGQQELGLAMQREALALQNIFRLPPQSGISERRVLVIVAPGDLAANNVIEFLLEKANITLDFLYFTQGFRLSPDLAAQYDLAFVAVAENDRTRALLNDIGNFLTDWPTPVINAPDRIARLTRDGACRLLSSQPGLRMPITIRADRADLQQVANANQPLGMLLPDGAFPVIVRPVDSHKGQGLARIDDAQALADYLATREEQTYYLANYIDYRSADGQFRKYRIVLIDGRPFVCHVAISDHWMVHYMSAGMTQSEVKRAEEAHVMATFDDDFAVRHADAFPVIADAIGLDYFGFDCGESPDGELIIFEFDCSMTVHAMDPVDMFPYKQPQMTKVFAAFRELLMQRSLKR